MKLDYLRIGKKWSFVFHFLNRTLFAIMSYLIHKCQFVCYCLASFVKCYPRTLTFEESSYIFFVVIFYSSILFRCKAWSNITNILPSLLCFMGEKVLLYGMFCESIIFVWTYEVRQFEQKRQLKNLFGHYVVLFQFYLYDNKIADNLQDYLLYGDVGMFENYF